MHGAQLYAAIWTAVGRLPRSGPRAALRCGLRLADGARPGGGVLGARWVAAHAPPLALLRSLPVARPWLSRGRSRTLPGALVRVRPCWDGLDPLSCATLWRPVLLRCVALPLRAGLVWRHAGVCNTGGPAVMAAAAAAQMSWSEAWYA